MRRPIHINLATIQSTLCASFCLLYATLLVTAAHAQQIPETQSEQRYSFVLIHVPLNQALDELINKTEIDIFFESELIRDKTTYCNIERATTKDALNCILSSAGLDFYQQSSGVYVIIPSQKDPPKLGSINGIVLDRETNEPLPYANIFLAEAGTGVATNAEGRFAISQLKPGMYQVRTSHVAYEETADSVSLAPSENQTLQIRLSPKTYLSTPIVVNGLQERLSAGRLNAYRVSASELQNAPASSTPSTLQSLDAVAGVHVGDALAEVHVQGGAAGEHQYLLDDAPVFVPIRNGGFFGSFSPFAIDQITVHKAGFEARHGSYLSGSVEMTHDLRSTDGSTATVQIDPLSANGRINGILREEKNISAQWMLAGRTDLWATFQPNQVENNFREWSQPNTFLSDALSGEISDPGSTNINFADSLLLMSFTDVHAAARIRFGSKSSIYGSLYRGKNDFGIGTIPFSIIPEDEDDDADADDVDTPAESYKWSNQMRQVRYEWVQGARLFAKVGMWTSNYRLSHPFVESPFVASNVAQEDEELSDDFNEIKEFGVHAGFDWAAGTRHVITGKVEIIDTESHFRLSIDPANDSLSISDSTVKPFNLRVQSFFEDTINLNESTRLIAGSRFTYIPLQQRLYAEPRFSFRKDFNSTEGNTVWALQFATGLYRQFYNQFDIASYISTAILPSFRFWIPIDKDTRASTAYHTALSLIFLPADRLQISIEGYYKYQPYLSVIDYTTRLSNNSDPNPSSHFLQRAKGRSYGGGITLAYQLGQFSTKASYEYAISQRRLQNRFNGQYIPVPWETPQQWFALLDYTPIKNLTLTLKWQGLYGRSWGFRRAYYDYLEPDPSLNLPFSLSSPQNDKLPAFTQWDFGLAYSKAFDRFSLQSRLNLVNIFDRENVIDWILVRDAQGQVIRRSRSATPFFPTLSIRLIIN